MQLMNQYLIPEWPAPENIHAFCSTRLIEGFSAGPYAPFNLSTKVDDSAQAVQQNREKLISDLKLPAQPLWLDQFHSNVAIVNHETSATTLPNTAAIMPSAITTMPKADASFAHVPNQICAVLTADCLPLLVCNRAGTEIAAIHAGWQGLHAGIIESTIQSMQSDPKEMMVWLGPAIGPNYLELNEQIMNDFCSTQPENKNGFFIDNDGHIFADIYTLAKNHLRQLGVEQIFGGKYCTYSESDLFYSYRRDQKITGRMASLIWFTANQ